MKRLLLKILAFLPILAVMVLANLLVDPAGLFLVKKTENELVRQLIRGRTVLIEKNIDSRLFHRIFADEIEAPFHILVFGSSRSNQINSAIFPGKTLFNASVGRGVLNDYVAIFQLYHERHMDPKIVIIGVDPWIFNPNVHQILWETLKPEYFRALERLGFKSAAKAGGFSTFGYRKFFELFTPSYFQESVNTLIKNRGFSQKTALIVKDPSVDSAENQMQIRPDGSRVWSDRDKNKSVQEVRAHAVGLISNGVSYLNNYTAMDPELIQIFQAFVDSMKSDGIQVVLFLPPFHPLLYDHFKSSEKLRVVLQVEEYLRELARSRGFILVGSFDPRAVGGGEDGFLDGVHLKGEMIDQIFAHANLADQL